MRFSDNSALITRLCGVFALALGAMTLAGWAFGLVQLLQLRPDWTPMVVNTAIGFLLSGTGLLLATWAGRWPGRIVVLLGLAIALLAVEELCVLFFDISPALSLPELHRALQPGYPHPGRMAPNTALCFLLFGIGLSAIERSRSDAMAIWARRAAITVLAIGLLGVIGYSLQLEYLYGWTGVVRMAVQTGVGMVVIGIGLWNLVFVRVGSVTIFDGKEVDGVYRSATLMLLLVAASAGIGGFSFLQDQMMLQAQEGMMQVSAGHARLFDQVLQHRSARAQVINEDDRPGVLLRALAKAPQDPGALAALRKWAGKYRNDGFSSISAEFGGQRWQLDGRAARPTLALVLKGRNPGWLLWQDGYLLRRALPLSDDSGIAGTLITEQPLPVLTTESATGNRYGETGELAVCGADGDVMQCFPLRSRSEPFSVPRVMAGTPLPMDYALRGMAGVIVAADYRQHRVLAAYNPIGDTGLGLVVKSDIAEIYTPIRVQFQRIVIFLGLLILIGLWVMRQRLRPLLSALEDSRMRAQAESERFSAAVESNLDAFFILECMRDAKGKAYDLRYVLVNARAERILQRTRSEVIGHGLCELYPERRSDGMLASYLDAVATGNPIFEERSAVANNGQMRWYHLQAVKLGDGLGVTVRDITASRHAADLIRHQAMHDPLTGLTNRAGFELALATTLAQAQQRKHVTALAMLDLDHFKEINDSYGHAAGDLLLQEVAARLRMCTRPSDTIARLGGDEFVLLLPNIKYPHGADVVARKLIAQVARPMQLDGHTVVIGISIGISAFPQDGATAEALLKHADAAMYRTKRAGRNGYAHYDAGVDGIEAQ